MSRHFRKDAYLLPVRQKDIMADFPGFSCGTFRDAPGQVWADFTHETDEFVVIAEGRVEISVAGNTAQCGPGDLVLIPARAVHSLRTSDDAGSVWFYGYGRFGGGDD